jgi:hypothetical protein
MVISNIRKLKFDQLLPLHGLLETVLGKKIEWFADEASNTIGAIAGCASGASAQSDQASAGAAANAGRYG